MNDPVGVKVFQGVDDLHGVALDLELVQPLSPLQQLIHTLIMAQFQEDVNIFTVFEKVHKLSDIRMLHRAMDFDLTHQLLLGSAPLQRRILNNFSGSYRFGLTLYKFIAFCKTTFAEEFSFDVLQISDVSILILANPLLDDLRALIRLSVQIGLAGAMMWGSTYQLAARRSSTGSTTL